MAEFSLELPKEEEIRAAVVEESRPAPAVMTQVEKTAEKNAQVFVGVDLDSPEARRDCVHAVESFGLTTVKKSEGANAILQRRMVKFSEAGGETGDVSRGLTDLTLRLKDLDPSQADFLKSGKLGRIFHPVRRYFEKFKTADEEIASIMKILEKGKKTLTDDNVTLELEQGSMRTLTKDLQQNIEIGVQMDEQLAAAVERLRAEGADPERVRFLEDEILFPLRQRIQDFQQLLAVDQQAIIAMEIIRRNNKELIRSVDRAKLVTVSALRTAVTVAGALYDQKVVLEKVSALNSETNRMIEATGKLLREQGTEIHRQAEETGISPDTLIAAFDDALRALEDISAYKQAALPRMKDSIERFRELSEEGERRIKALEDGVGGVGGEDGET